MAGIGRTTHGLSRTKEYTAFHAMKARCGNPKHTSFERYGGRGIYVCDEWANSIEKFLADMGPKPTPSHTVERIDNNGPYAPWNCKWATPREQALNQRLRKRGNRILTFRGETNCMAKLARKYGLKTHTVLRRLNANWTVERALTTAPRDHGKRVY